MDARTLEPSALHLLRRQVVQAVRGGMSQTDAARTFKASLRAVSTWRRLDREGGLRALTLKRRGRRPGEGRLNATRAGRIRSLIVGTLPDQLKLPFYLWPRAAVASLIAREYGIEVSLVTVGRYLRAWGLGLEPAEAGAARRREERCGQRAVAETGIPGACPAGQAGARRHLLGRRNGAAQ
jgi:transposase